MTSSSPILPPEFDRPSEAATMSNRAAAMAQAEMAARPHAVAAATRLPLELAFEIEAFLRPIPRDEAPRPGANPRDSEQVQRSYLSRMAGGVVLAQNLSFSALFVAIELRMIFSTVFPNNLLSNNPTDPAAIRIRRGIFSVVDIIDVAAGFILEIPHFPALVQSNDPEAWVSMTPLGFRTHLVAGAIFHRRAVMFNDGSVQLVPSRGTIIVARLRGGTTSGTEVQRAAEKQSS